MEIDLKIDVSKWFRGLHLERVFEKISPEIKAAIHIGVLAVEGIKAINDSFVGDVIQAILPPEVAGITGTIREKLHQDLPKLLVELKLADSCTGLTDPNEIVMCGIKVLQQVDGDFKSDFLDAIAVHLSIIAADNKLDWNDAKHLVKWYYDHKFKPEVGQSA